MTRVDRKLECRERVPPTQESGGIKRYGVHIRGAVQGVGFRPFVYGLAFELGLKGWVTNSPAGVDIEIEGSDSALESFLVRLKGDVPPNASIQGLEYTVLDPRGYSQFEIRESVVSGAKTAMVMPDIATCSQCLEEIRDPTNRRYRYPFTNCTHCGPRYSIIRSLPYDRCRTTMTSFVMCPACRREYDDPSDRRFHAQPNACPQCGPQLAYWDSKGRTTAIQNDALIAAASAIRDGRIVAVKGLGGFHLIVDARQDEWIERLRTRKHREEKPFALMVPSMGFVRNDCEVSEFEERLLTAPEAPVVLLRRRSVVSVSDQVAPGNAYLGIMIPYTPLHTLLLEELHFPVIATSANLSEEPICIDEKEARVRLADIVDGFLVHDRPIARHVDDSIVRVVLGREQVIRRARGYAPFPVQMPHSVDGILAVGGQMKNTVALGVGDQLFASQHIGDLDTSRSMETFRDVIDDFQLLYEKSPYLVACDEHPEYESTRYAHTAGLPVHSVQHHIAHIAACMAENQVEPPALGVAWDGTGFGPDGSLWGGEFLAVDEQGTYRRIGKLRPFCLPGGDHAVREPRRSAMGLLYEMMADDVFKQVELAPVQAFRAAELRIIRTMCRNGINAPITSSMGRLFDAISSILGLRQFNRFEGQAAMELEFAAATATQSGLYPYRIEALEDGNPAIVDWSPLVGAILEELRAGVEVAKISDRFHSTLAQVVLDFSVKSAFGKIVLGGGCFQNRLLTERVVTLLREKGFAVYLPQRIPVNDGGICVGQAAIASSRKSGHISPLRLNDAK